MKKTFGIAACIGMLAVSSMSAFAQFSSILTIDESGSAYLSPSQMFPYTIGTDAFSGINTLEYTLPFAGVVGDLLITDPSSSQVSDILRFDGNFHVFFFSETGGGGLADVGLPTALQANTATVAEIGTEGVSTYANYTPTANQPGYKPAAPGMQYHIISDVPEPSVMILGTLGGSLLLFWRTRRQS
jgi:hypothetical protein